MPWSAEDYAESRAQLAMLRERLRHRENGRLASGAVMLVGGALFLGFLFGGNRETESYSGSAGLMAALIAIVFYIDAKQAIAGLERRIGEIERAIKDLWPAP